MTAVPGSRPLPRLLRIIRLRARLFVCAAVALLSVGLLFAFDWQSSRIGAATKVLIGWDLGLTLYLALAFQVMARADLAHIRTRAALLDEGALALLLLPAAAAVASLGAIFAELVTAKGPDVWRPPHVALAVLTITLSWCFIHTLFALHYAHDYYGRGQRANGLQFPGNDKPDYWDFAYFSFVIGMTFQVSDVVITNGAIRRLVLAHGILSFVFNTAILALTVNLASSG